MLSDLSCTTLSFDIPILDPSTLHLEEDSPLNFDDLLDIAREFEFTRTITHIWPCEEEPSTCPETGLNDILAAIVPTPNTEASPVPSATIEEVDLRKPASVCLTSDAPASIPTIPVRLLRDDDQFEAETAVPITGWSPPDGSRFLDLDDSLMQPESVKNAWTSPWLTMFLAPSVMLPPGDVNQPFVASDVRSGLPPVDMADKSVDDHRKRSVPTPVPSLGTAQPRPALRTSSNMAGQTAANPREKSRQHSYTTPVAGRAPAGNYARAPRGGIPPHIARSVTKANILRAEKERKVMQEAFSSKAPVETKKPSVLRRTAKNASSGGSGKKHSNRDESDGTEGRTSKKARV